MPREFIYLFFITVMNNLEQYGMFAYLFIYLFKIRWVYLTHTIYISGREPADSVCKEEANLER